MSDINGTVVKIQGNNVSSSAPSDGDVLTWDNSASEWKPSAPKTLEPWVGSVNSQQQVIKRIPFTCQTTGTAWVSTGVSFTVPTDSALVLWAHVVSRSVANKGVICQVFQLCIANNSGTLTTQDKDNLATSSVSGTSVGNPDVQLSISGTTVTLEVAHPGAGGGAVADWQGFVDLLNL